VHSFWYYIKISKTHSIADATLIIHSAIDYIDYMVGIVVMDIIIERLTTRDSLHSGMHLDINGSYKCASVS